MQTNVQKKTDNRRRTSYGNNTRWQDWTRQHLGDGFLSINDIDALMFFREKKERIEHIMFVEVKCFRQTMPANQRISFNIIDAIMKAGVRSTNGLIHFNNGYNHEVKYHGFHFLQFEKTNPTDGLIWWNNQGITEQELIEKLTLC